MPPGVIVLWNYLMGPIPAGWHLCDGTNGTPLIENRFIRASHLANPPGSVGGAWSHVHGFSASPHSHATEPGADYHVGPPATGQNANTVVTGTTGNSSEVPRWIAFDFIMKL